MNKQQTTQTTQLDLLEQEELRHPSRLPNGDLYKYVRVYSVYLMRGPEPKLVSRGRIHTAQKLEEVEGLSKYLYQLGYEVHTWVERTFESDEPREFWNSLYGSLHEY